MMCFLIWDFQGKGLWKSYYIENKITELNCKNLMKNLVCCVIINDNTKLSIIIYGKVR